MKEISEFRVRDIYAKEFLSAKAGNSIMDSISIARPYKTPVGSDLYFKFGKLTEFVRNRDNKYFFFGWNIQRNYTKKELGSAELLLLKISKTIEPAGIECGTVYESKNLCEDCGFGSEQISELILDLKAVPQKVDIARTISNEIIISQEFAQILINNDIKGYAIKPVHHLSSKYQNNTWYQLFITSRVDIASVTKTGNDPFDLDETNEYRCKNGHTIGLDILSELSIIKDTWDGSDFVVTNQLFGVNRGLLHTYPLIAISQRLYKLLNRGKCRGFSVEVVHAI